jgi:hypothetical protein
LKFPRSLAPAYRHPPSAVRKEFTASERVKSTFFGASESSLPHVGDRHKASSAEGQGALILRNFPESPPEARNRERKIHETRFNGVATRTSQMLSAGCMLSNQEATNALRQAGSKILSDGTDQQLTLYSRGLVSAEIKGLDHPFDRSKLRLLRYGEGDAPPRLRRPSGGRVLRGGRDRGAIPRPGGPHRSRGCDRRE